MTPPRLDSPLPGPPLFLACSSPSTLPVAGWLKPQPVYVGHIPAGVLWSVSAACLCYLPTFTVCLLQGKTFSVSYKVTWLPDMAGEPSGQQTSGGWAGVGIKRNKSVYYAWLINDWQRLREPECGNGNARTEESSTASWKDTLLKIVPGSWNERTSRNVLTVLQKSLEIETWNFRASSYRQQLSRCRSTNPNALSYHRKKKSSHLGCIKVDHMQITGEYEAMNPPTNSSI